MEGIFVSVYGTANSQWYEVQWSLVPGPELCTNQKSSILVSLNNEEKTGGSISSFKAVNELDIKFVLSEHIRITVLGRWRQVTYRRCYCGVARKLTAN